MMNPFLSLRGTWQLAPDPLPCQLDTSPADFPLTMQLPGTTAQQQIGTFNSFRADGCFTEKYPFAGQIWLRRTVTLTPEQASMPHCFLHLERTRMTRLWVNGQYIGSENSLCTPHIYDLSGHTTEHMELVLCVKNTDYPIPGGHMTSPDTQTNWIGVTGDISLEFRADTYISDLLTFPDAAKREVMIKGILHGAETVNVQLSAAQSPYPCCGGANYDVPAELTLSADENGAFAVTVPLPENAPLWSEYDPLMIALYFSLPNGESAFAEFGLRDFRACGDHFEINGIPTMLRGKHDALVFPRTGAAPTDSTDWIRRFALLKEWGINHVRFHTCCPPEAAFEAADTVGIYMEPELPFWGTLDAPGGEKYDAEQQAYLIREGLRICKAFGNHPSFCMFSLGNELWGSPERLGEIITTLRTADPRPLYTQGSNNFQHAPVQIPEEDFWTGVRTHKGRLLRGSFADCDAPLGYIQTHAPSASWDYEEYLAPHDIAEAAEQNGADEIEIQFGTGVKTVKAVGHDEHFVPTVPVVTHEIGQYNMYPDYREIEKYKADSVVEARSFEIFRDRLEKAGMGNQAEQFFRCTGAFARGLYKTEIEAAMRSPHIAGFQLLDLQDFPGQGTALVGMLNARMENKGFIAPEQWRAFCGDLVPLAIFDTFVWTVDKPVTVRLAVRCSRPVLRAQTAEFSLLCGTETAAHSVQIPANAAGLVPLGCVTLTPRQIGKALLSFSLPEEHIRNTWELTILPEVTPVDTESVRIAHSAEEAAPMLQNGGRVLLLTGRQEDGIPGFYCTDFWNYHMFRIISESMGKPVPVGTMGLCIDTAHPIAQAMFSEEYSTPQWYSIVTHADCAVLDGMPAGFRPIVQVIDNVERNRRLGLLWETECGGGTLLVCTVRFDEAPEDIAMNRLYHAVTDYVKADRV